MFPILSGSLCEVNSRETSQDTEKNQHENVNNTRSSCNLSMEVARSSVKLLSAQNSKECLGTNMDNNSSFTNDRISSPFPMERVTSPEESQTIEMDGITTTIQNQSCDELHYVSSSALSNVSEGPICRICHDGEDNEDLLSPCHCTGTVGLLHLSCLETWLGSSSRTKCELCGFEYTVDSKSKPFKEWIYHPSSPNDRRNLICDLACFVLLTPLATISSWLCLIGAQYYSYWAGRWEVPGLIALTVFLMCIYLTWCLVVIRYHYHVWTDWKKHNQIVRIKAVKQGNIVSRNLKEATGNNLLYSQRNSPQSNRHTVNATQESNNNNNNNTVGIEVESSEDDDVVVEVSRGAGRRDSYKLLSHSNNLVCSPNKPSNLSTRSPRRNLYFSSPKSQQTSTGPTSSARRSLLQTSGARSRLLIQSTNAELVPEVECPGSPASPEAEFVSRQSPMVNSTSPLNISVRTASTSSDDSDYATPLLLASSSPKSSSYPVSESLVNVPEFMDAASQTPLQSLVTYRVGGNVSNTVFRTLVQSSNDTQGYNRLNQPVRETYV